MEVYFRCRQALLLIEHHHQQFELGLMVDQSVDAKQALVDDVLIMARLYSMITGQPFSTPSCSAFC